METQQDYPLFYISGANYTVAGNEYAGPTDEIIGSLEQCQIVLSNLLGEQAEFAGLLDYRTEYQLRAVQCWYCTNGATFNSKRPPFEFCADCASEYDAGQEGN